MPSEEAAGILIFPYFLYDQGRKGAKQSQGTCNFNWGVSPCPCAENPAFTVIYVYVVFLKEKFTFKKTFADNVLTPHVIQDVHVIFPD